MDMRQAFKRIQANALAGVTTILEGPPGGGKTDLAAKFVRWWADLPEHKGKRIGSSCFFMATQTPIGFTGLPWKGEKDYGDGKKWTITDPAIPQWFMATDLATGEVRPASMFDSVPLIIEEWGQGSPETKRAGAEVLRARGTPPFYLPLGSPCLALSNTDLRDGVTKEFDFTINRVSKIPLTPSIDVWVEDFADHPYKWDGKTWNVMPVSKAWAKTRGSGMGPGSLFEPAPEKQGPRCTPRSFTNLDRVIQVETERNEGVIPVREEWFIELCQSLIGMPATQSYVQHLQFRLEIPSLEDVINAPETTSIPTRADLQMLMAYEYAGRVKEEHLAPVINFMQRKEMPQDMAVTFISTLLRRNYSLVNNPVMDVWFAKNARLLSIVTALAAPR